MALGYLDFSAEEFLVSACLSGDEHMIDAYYGGDPYMGVGIALGLAPRGATGDSHPAVRALMKVLLLGLGYGMKVHGLQKRTGLSFAECESARGLLPEPSPPRAAALGGQTLDLGT